VKRGRGTRAGIPGAAALAALLAATPVLSQELFSVHPGSLGARCADAPVLAGPLETVYAAMQRPGDADADASLAILQDSAATVLSGDPDNLEARYLLASVLGARSEVASGRAKIEWAGAMDGEVRLILEQDPSHPGAQHLLGRLHAGVRRLNRIKRFIARTLFGGAVLAGASWESAQLHLEAAEAGAPCLPDHHYELARLYHDLGMEADAYREIRHTLEVASGRPEFDAVRSRAMALAEDARPAGDR